LLASKTAAVSNTAAATLQQLVSSAFEQDPAVVAAELASAADTVAAHFAAVTASQWLRPGRRSDGASFTVETFGRYFIHDPIHHLYDVTGHRRA
jgi:hypothetical protein